MTHINSEQLLKTRANITELLTNFFSPFARLCNIW